MSLELGRVGFVGGQDRESRGEHLGFSGETELVQ